MGKTPHISDAEWEVMNAVWSDHPVAAGDIVAALEHTGWHSRTVKTMINRLVKKGALGYEQDGNRYLYFPLVAREVCVRRESTSFVERVFGGSVAPMLVHFVENNQLSEEELQELKRILNEKED